MKRFLLACALALLPATVSAQLGSVPHTFTADTEILAAEVNTNFSTAYSNALNRTGGTMTGTLTSQALIPASTNTYDLGSTLVKYRDAWFSRNVDIAGDLAITGSISDSNSAVTIGDQLQVTSTTTPQLQVRYDGSNYLEWSVSSAGAITVNAVGASQAFIFSDAVTVNGDFNASTYGAISTNGNFTSTAGMATFTSTSPLIKWIESGATADEGHWRLVADADALSLQAMNDAEGVFNNIWVIGRSGATVDSFEVYAAATRIADGSASAPSLGFLNDTNTGIYRSAADTLNFATGGTSRWQVDSSGNLLPTTAQAVEIGGDSNEVLLLTLSDGTVTNSGICITETSNCGTGNYATISYDFSNLLISAEGTIGSSLTLRGGAGTVAWSGSGDMDMDDLAITFQETTSARAGDALGNGTEARIYFKSNNIIFQYNDGGTVRYKSLDLTGTGVTWVHSTTEP